MSPRRRRVVRFSIKPSAAMSEKETAPDSRLSQVPPIATHPDREWQSKQSPDHT
jgi:hypothetical protein